MTVHYPDAGTIDNKTGSMALATSICPAPVLDAKAQLTIQIEHVTCADCIVRLLAELHRQQAVLLSTMAGVVVAAQKAAKDARIALARVND